MFYKLRYYFLCEYIASNDRELVVITVIVAVALIKRLKKYLHTMTVYIFPVYSFTNKPYSILAQRS